MTDLKALFSELIRFETELWNAVDARLRADYDLPLSRFEPMQVIARHGTCRVNDIAEELAITVGGTSKLVDRIEASGHCRRRPDPDDGRSSIIELTPAGRRLLIAATDTVAGELVDRLGSVVSARAATVQRHPDQAATGQQPCHEHRQNHLNKPHNPPSPPPSPGPA